MTQNLEKSKPSYEQIKNSILEEARTRFEKDKINKECLKQIEIVEKAKANYIKEEQKLFKLVQKKEAL